MDSGLQGKTVIVTGGSGGIGQAVVRKFALEGANVVIHYLQAKEAAENLAHSIKSTRAIAIGADLSTESQVRSLFDQSESQLGQVDILVANAGRWPEPDVPIHEMSLQRWQDTFANNSTSIFLCVREFLNRASQHQMPDPSIVMTGSTAGHFGEAGHADYAAGKSSFMHGLCKSLKNEIVQVCPRGRVNAVCPGWTLTPMARELTKDKSAMEKALQTIALRKFASSEDIANSIVFLSSNQLAGHITGQTLFVDGGMEGRVLFDSSEIELDRALPRYE